MLGREIKAEAVREGVPLYRVAVAADMHPNRLSALLSGRATLTATEAARIRDAIGRLAPKEPAGV
jgi:plasmid maintenance system antidote protein VapI